MKKYKLGKNMKDSVIWNTHWYARRSLYEQVSEELRDICFFKVNDQVNKRILDEVAWLLQNKSDCELYNEKK